MNSKISKNPEEVLREVQLIGEEYGDIHKMYAVEALEYVIEQKKSWDLLKIIRSEKFIGWLGVISGVIVAAIIVHIDISLYNKSLESEDKLFRAAEASRCGWVKQFVVCNRWRSELDKVLSYEDVVKNKQLLIEKLRK